MIWSWDASASPDIAAYVLAATLLLAPAQTTGWLDIGQTAGLTLDDGLPDPPLGACWLLSVDAVDGAGNRSA